MKRPTAPLSPATLQRRVALLGHASLALVALHLVQVVVWRLVSDYDAAQELVGPTWLIRLGGERAPFAPGLLAGAAGIGAATLGMVHRRVRTRNHGLLATTLSLLGMTAYAWILF